MPQDRPWVVVSGAGGALGSLLAAHYARQGSPVLALDRQTANLAGQSVVARQVDLCSEQQVGAALDEALTNNGRIGLLVNAVGEIWNEPVLSLRGSKMTLHDAATWRRVVESNLTAAFLVAAAAAARMVRTGGGAIVNFSSIASDGNSGQAAYSAAKAGVEGLTRTMGIELGPFGVRVNAIALGFIDVATTRHAVSGEVLEGYADRTPLRRLGRAEDVVNAVEFLASNEFVNGEIVKIDGGLRL